MVTLFSMRVRTVPHEVRGEILEAFSDAGGNFDAVAGRLGIGRRALYRAICILEEVCPIWEDIDAIRASLGLRSGRPNRTHERDVL